MTPQAGSGMSSCVFASRALVETWIGLVRQNPGRQFAASTNLATNLLLQQTTELEAVLNIFPVFRIFDGCGQLSLMLPTRWMLRAGFRKIRLRDSKCCGKTGCGKTVDVKHSSKEHLPSPVPAEGENSLAHQCVEGGNKLGMTSLPTSSCSLFRCCKSSSFDGGARVDPPVDNTPFGTLPVSFSTATSAALALVVTRLSGKHFYPTRDTADVVKQPDRRFSREDVVDASLSADWRVLTPTRSS